MLSSVIYVKSQLALDATQDINAGPGVLKLQICQMHHATESALHA